ncbi:TRAP transporter substrate-binding protein [Oceanobacillus kapialis]|uniref:TRAP transporter substrate-binding protein n=1 Tax=Oceanobacillus kapialis TaxID=481353 RepID=UPI003850DF7C
MKKRSFYWVIGSLLTVLLLAACGQDDAASGENGEEYTIKFAHVVSPSTAKGKAAEKFGELIEERTDGQIKVEVYPDSQLGSDREIIEQMQSGTVQMNAPFTGVLPTFVKDFEVFDLPFLFEDRDHAFEATNGNLGDILGEKLEAQGMHLLGFWDGGFKHLTNSVHPIETPEDMNELKMRVSQSPLLISQFQAVNAGGVSIDFSELYTALQTGTVDGQENPLSNIVSKKFYEVQDYLTLSSHGYMAYPLVISSDYYKNLPEDLQTAVDEVANEVTEWQWEEANSDEEAYMEELEGSDIQINELTADQKQAFKDAMSSVYDEFNKMDGSEELLEAVNQ